MNEKDAALLVKEKLKYRKTSSTNATNKVIRGFYFEIILKKIVEKTEKSLNVCKGLKREFYFWNKWCESIYFLIYLVIFNDLINLNTKTKH